MVTSVNKSIGTLNLGFNRSVGLEILKILYYSKPTNLKTTVKMVALGALYKLKADKVIL